MLTYILLRRHSKRLLGIYLFTAELGKVKQRIDLLKRLGEQAKPIFKTIFNSLILSQGIFTDVDNIP